MQRSDAIVAISDGRAGNARQALALAEALAEGAAVRHVQLLPHAPWRWLAPRRCPGTRWAFGPGFAALLAAPPAIAVGCGRQAALATRLLRGRGSRAVQILDPRLSPRHWDALVLPEHDVLRGPNVVTLVGSLNPVDDAWLQRGRQAFPLLGTLPSPRIALLVGGPTAQAPWREDAAAALFAAIAAQLRRDGGSVLATTSRRTPAATCAALRRAFADVPGRLWCGDGDGPNPYPGLLGWAEHIVCTPDSANLLSEACATRAPVQVALSGCARGRMQTLQQRLLQSGRIVLASSTPAAAEEAAVVPLRETVRVARQLRPLLMPA